MPGKWAILQTPKQLKFDLMRATDDLFQLIKSLKPSEKRYIRVQANRQGGDVNYMKLFDAIDAQKEYDETELKSKFIGGGFSSQFSVTKNYLSGLILNGLRHYDSANSVNAQLKTILQNVEILFKKALFKQSHKELRKAKKLAIHYDKYPMQLEVFRWEKRIRMTQFTFVGPSDELQAVFEEEREVQIKINRIYALEQIQYKLSRLITNRGIARKKSEADDFHAIMNDPVINEQAILHDFLPKAYLYNIYHLYYRAVRDENRSYEAAVKRMELFDAHPHQIEEQLHNYIGVLNNLLHFHVEVCDIVTTFETIEKLKALPQKYSKVLSATDKLKIYVATGINELNLLQANGQFSKALEVMQEYILPGFKKYEKEIPDAHYITLCFTIATIYFGNNLIDTALDWITRILNNSHWSTKEDTLCLARIYNLIFHYENDNIALIEYEGRNTQRFLNRRGKLHELEKAIINLIYKRLPKLEFNKNKRVEELKNVRNKIVETNKALVYSNEAYRGLITWIDSKIEDVSYAEIAEKQAAALREKQLKTA